MSDGWMFLLAPSNTSTFASFLFEEFLLSSFHNAILVTTQFFYDERTTAALNCKGTGIDVLSEKKKEN